MHVIINNIKNIYEICVIIYNRIIVEVNIYGNELF